MIKILDDNNFTEEVIKVSQSKPVLVDFYADWCGPCKMMMPIFEQIDGEIGDKAIIGKVNIDQASVIVDNYGIMSVPTFLLFKNGQMVESFIGAQPKDTLISAINKHI